MWVFCETEVVVKNVRSLSRYRNHCADRILGNFTILAKFQGGLATKKFKDRQNFWLC